MNRIAIISATAPASSTTGFQIAAGLLIGLRLIVGGLLLYSGLAKLWLPFDFLDDVYGYELLGRTAGYGVAAFMPWLEVVVGTAVLTGVATAGGFLLSLAMFAVFIFVQAWAVAWGLNVNCGCFGSATGNETDVVGIATLVRTSFLAAAAGVGYVLQNKLGRNVPSTAVEINPADPS